MGIKTLKKILNQTPAFPSDLNQFYEALTGNFVPRNSNGAVEGSVHNVGSEDFKFKDTYADEINAYEVSNEFRFKIIDNKPSLRGAQERDAFILTPEGFGLGSGYTQVADNADSHKNEFIFDTISNVGGGYTKTYTINCQGGVLFLSFGIHLYQKKGSLYYPLRSYGWWLDGMPLNPLMPYLYVDSGSHTFTFRTAPSYPFSETALVSIFEVVQ